MRKLNRSQIIILILLLAGSAVYVFNLHNPLFWDDDEWIKNNPFVHDFQHLGEIFSENILSGFGLNSNYYRPFLLVTFAINYALHDIQPLGYHLVNNGLHLASGVLVFILLRRVLGQRAAWLTALLWLIHPAQIEAVTYISGRGDPLSVFFMLLALWLFVRAKPTAANYRWLIAGSLLAMAVAVLSREIAVLMPALLVVYIISFLSSQRLWPGLKTALARTWPYWALSMAYLLLRLTVLNFENTLNFYSQANSYTEHLSYRIYTFGAALVEYIKIIFVPVGLHMERDLPVNTAPWQWPVWLAALVVFGILYLVVRFYKKERIENAGPVIAATNFRVWFFGVAWFFIALAPASGIIPINALLYEHWLYLPLIGLFALAAFYLDRLWNWVARRHRLIYAVFILALVGYLAWFGIVSARRNLAWGQPAAFYEDTLRYNPDSVRILNNLGNLYSAQGDLDRAITVYQRATNGSNGNIFAQPHYNLGNIYRDRQQTNLAIAEYQAAIAIDPAFPFAYQNLAVIYVNQNRIMEAIELLEKVRTLRPREPRVYYNLALLYLAQNKNALALDRLQSALQLAEHDPMAKAIITELLAKLR